MMVKILKMMAKIGAVFVLSAGVGYAEYRIKGGKTIRQLYNDVQRAKMEAETEESKKEPIKGEGTVN